MIRLLVLDVDGTMTDGGVYYDATGNETKKFAIKDGAGLVLARTAGIRVMICTGRECEAVRRRAADLKITDVYQNVGKKAAFLRGFMAENHYAREEVAYCGDDLNDLAAMALCGFVACPEDAAAESLRLETLLPQIPALHPQAQRLAKDAIALLQTAFRVSQELMCIDAHASEQDAPEGTYRYFLQETWEPARMRCSYGLLGQQRQSGCWTTLAVISPFSDDRAAVERLARLCTAQQLDPVHLFDVIHDFLDQEAATV